MVDTAPAGGVLIDGLISAANWILVPTKPDEASLLGLARVAARVGELAAQGRPVAELLGVVLFGISSQATGLRRETRESLEALLPGTGGKVFNTVIRGSERAAVDQAGAGLWRPSTQRPRFALSEPWYRNRQAPRFCRRGGRAAGDYAALADEVLADIAERRRRRCDGAGSMRTSLPVFGDRARPLRRRAGRLKSGRRTSRRSPARRGGHNPPARRPEQQRPSQSMPALWQPQAVAPGSEGRPAPAADDRQSAAGRLGDDWLPAQPPCHCGGSRVCRPAQGGA